MSTPVHSVRSTLGALEAGGSVSILYVKYRICKRTHDMLTVRSSLSGIATMQTYLYYRVYPKDKLHLKCLVCTFFRSHGATD